MLKVDQQLTQNDCGISVVKTILDYHKIDIPRDYIKDNIPLDQSGSSFSDLKIFLNKHGIEARFKLVDFDNNTINYNYLKSLAPFIVTIKKKNRVHYVIVDKINKNKVHVLDPATYKNQWLSYDHISKIIYRSKNQIKYVDISEKLLFHIKPELLKYDLNDSDYLTESRLVETYNKLLYFSSIRDNYGFKDYNTEKRFLNDLLKNTEISNVPREFRSFKTKNDLVQIEAPLILSAKRKVTKSVDIPYIDSSDKNIYLRLFKSIGRNKRIWMIFLFSTLFAAGISRLALFINQILIDKILPSNQLNVLVYFSIGFAVFKFLEIIINQFKNYVSIHFGNILDKFFLLQFDNKLNRLSIEYIESFRRGDLTERLSDTMRLKRFFTRFFTQILVDSTISIFSLGALFLISWKASLVIGFAMILYFLWYKIITPYLQSNEKIRFNRKADLMSLMIEKIDGIQVIKNFRIQNTISYKIFNSINNLISIQTKVSYVNLINLTLVAVISSVSSLFIIIVLGRQSIMFQENTLGQVVTFILLSNRVFASLGKILSENMTLQEYQVILRRFFDFDENNKEESEISTISNFELDKYEFKKVSYQYNGGKTVLRDLSFTVNKNDKIRIYGSNGSGKTTLGKVMSCGLSNIIGDVFINDHPSFFYDKEKLKEKILLVTNHDRIFNESIRYNICFDRNIGLKKLLELSKVVGFYDFVKKLEDGFDHVINEGGKNLSTGQQKKILLLRALCSTADLIILDEVLSGIDLDSRSMIEKHLNKLNKALILISHENIDNIYFSKEYTLVNGRFL